MKAFLSFDVKIIITIRKQEEALVSSYAQSFNHTYLDIKKIDTFKKYINDILYNFGI